MKNENKSSDTILHQKAGEPPKKKTSKSNLRFSDADILKLVHELEVHQIEMEMQNIELKQAKEREAELATEKYIELYDLAPSGYFTLSKEGRIIDLNLSGALMLGKDRIHLKFNWFVLFVTSDTKTVFNLFLTKVFNSKSREACEVSLSVDGSLPLYVQLTGIAAENGEQCFVTAVDITQRKRIEESLQLSEHRLIDVLFSLADWLWEVDENNSYTFSSQKGIDLLGSSDTNIIGKTPFDFMPPEEARRMAAIFTESARKKAPIKDLENWNINVNGERICLLTNGVPMLDAAKNLIGYRGVNKDITKRKRVEEALSESENLYRSLFENMLNGFAYCKMHFDANDFPVDYTYLAVNDAFGFLTGLTDVVGKRVTEIIPGFRENDQELINIYGRVSRNGKPERFEFFMGSLQMWFSISVYCLQYSFFVTVFDVITERKKAEEEIQKSIKIQQQFQKHLTEIRENERAVISREIHDQLGQSMTALKLDMNWLQANVRVTPEIKAKLAGMVELITHTISDVQRISAELRPGILDDLGLAAAIEWYAEELGKRSKVLVIMDLDEVQAKSDQKNLAFFRVLQEALTNVIRHAQAKTVEIKLHEIEEHVVLEIVDDGIGIPVEKIKSIRSLGLQGMQDRVNQVGGTLDVLGGEVSGTKIRISIPI